MSEYILRVDITSNPQVIDFTSLIPETAEGNWKISLINWSLFATDYVVNSLNNTFVITHNAIVTNITVANGNYTVTSYISAIDTAIKAAISNAWGANLNTVTGTIRIYGDLAFTITTTTRQAKLLGFISGVVSSTANEYIGTLLPYVASSPWYGITASSTVIPGSDSGGYAFRIPAVGIPGTLNMPPISGVPGNSCYSYGGIGSVTFTINTHYGDTLDTLNQPIMLVFSLGLTAGFFV